MLWKVPCLYPTLGASKLPCQSWRCWLCSGRYYHHYWYYKYRFGGSHSLHTFQTYDRVVPDLKSLFFRQHHVITGETLDRNGGKENQICPFRKIRFVHLRCSGKQQCAACSAAVGLDFLICFRPEEGAGGKTRADFAVIWWELSVFPVWQGNCLKSTSWKAWPHLLHLLSNFREGLGSNTKPFSFSLSHFPFSQAVSIEVCLLPPLFLLLQRQWCLLALSEVKSDFGTLPSAVMKVTAGRVSAIW